MPTITWKRKNGSKGRNTFKYKKDITLFRKGLKMGGATSIRVITKKKKR